MQSETNIKLAYRNIKRNGGRDTAGVDGLTMKDVEHLPTEEVIERVQTMFKHFKPLPIRRVMIPKPNGKQRPLGIPCIWDRIFQQCILQILEPIMEAKFHPHSYGFRPNRSTKHAIARMNHLINVNKLYHCIDVDIEGFFDNINHGKLIKQLWTLGIKDKKLIKIISELIKSEIKGIGNQNKGTPQGGILSPLLSNVVLNELDWWVSNQWETFSTKHNYTRLRTHKGKTFLDESNKFRAIKNSNLKEIYIVRYADDFKIMCKTRNQAIRMKIAIEKFLKDRLNLETSKEKSKVINLKKSSSEFLGFKIKAVQKGITTKKIVKREWYVKNDGSNGSKTIVLGYTNEPKYVAFSHMTDKAIKNAEHKIKTAIKKIQRNPSAQTVRNYNSVVMGIQNYYTTATHITKNLRDINFHCQRTLFNRLNKLCKNATFNDFSKLQKERYKGCRNKLLKLQEYALVPINFYKHQSAMNFSQEISKYTDVGREMIHKKIKIIPKHILEKISSQNLHNRSIEYTDNRISKYIAQHGKCAITGIELGTMFHCHHINPFHISKDDSFSNLVILQEDIHRAIHMKDEKKIAEVVKLYEIKGKKLQRFNDFRRLVGNPSFS